jgi:putative hydrolase of the HAD superfamily
VIDPRPEVVFFDLGDTLMRTHPSWASVYLLGLREHGIDVAEEELARALAAAAATGAWMVEGAFEATEQASYERVKAYDQAVLDELGYPDLPDPVFRSIERAFMRRSSWHVFPDVQPTIEALRDAGLRLGVISNWVWGGPELLHDVELAQHFDGVVVSARVGFQKPDPGIFRHALELLDVTPDKAIHVGDSYQADVLGARRVGITPVLIDRRVGDAARLVGEGPDGADDQVPRIADLYGLLELLGLPRPAISTTR